MLEDGSREKKSYRGERRWSEGKDTPWKGLRQEVEKNKKGRKKRGQKKGKREKQERISKRPSQLPLKLFQLLL